MRKVYEARNDNARVTVIVHYDSNTRDYRARVYDVRGFFPVAFTECDYFTDDKEDAIGTARLMAQSFVRVD